MRLVRIEAGRFGKIDGRECAVVANDFTVMGASSSATNGKKIGHMKRTATARDRVNRPPIAGLRAKLGSLAGT